VVAKGTRLVFVAGQVAKDNRGELVAPRHGLQARQGFDNLGRALAAAGAKPEQVTKLTIFLANFRREHLAMIEQGRIALFGTYKPADTLVSVATLFRAEYLIEVDAIAVDFDA
jgi:enamine deaminase RidA (YjgF/YER057c/UK114 family)